MGPERPRWAHREAGTGAPRRRRVPGRGGEGGWTAGRGCGGRGAAGGGGPCGRRDRGAGKGGACAPARAGGREAGTARPPALGAALRTDSRTALRAGRPAMFSRSSRRRLSSRSVSVPHRSGADRRPPPGRLERPCPEPRCPAAAHLWPQVSRPRRRVGARPELSRGLRGAGGVKPGPGLVGREGERDQNCGPRYHNLGAPRRLPPSPLPSRRLRIPPLKPQRPASLTLAADLTSGLPVGVSCAVPFPVAAASSKASALPELLPDSGQREGLAFVS